jgi:hypothetical protein
MWSLRPAAPVPPPLLHQHSMQRRPPFFAGDCQKKPYAKIIICCRCLHGAVTQLRNLPHLLEQVAVVLVWLRSSYWPSGSADGDVLVRYPAGIRIHPDARGLETRLSCPSFKSRDAGRGTTCVEREVGLREWVSEWLSYLRLQRQPPCGCIRQIRSRSEGS